MLFIQRNGDSDARIDQTSCRIRVQVQEKLSSAVTVAPGCRAGSRIGGAMITLPTKKPARNRKAKARKAIQDDVSRVQKEKQAGKPDIDSAALHRRAVELSTEIQRGYIVDKNNEKVERIKAEIENGTYEVDAEAIAEKLMEYDFQLADKNKPDNP